jgi:mannose-6-phosphate isomerase-like protein (cupin superfamily)
MLVTPNDGRIADLGAIKMRVLAAGKESTQGNFTLAEFSGGPGVWTVPHIHRGMEESFFVLDGTFTFTFGHEPLKVDAGSYLLVPRGTRHMIEAGDGGGRLLTLMVPGGLEEMFFELAELPPGALTDPAVRAAISARYDSVPSAS